MENINYRESYYKIESYIKIGVIYIRLERYEESLKIFNKAAKIKYKSSEFWKSPLYANLYNNRGWTYYKLKKYKKAIKDFERAIGFDYGYAIAYGNISLVKKVLNKGNRRKSLYI